MSNKLKIIISMLLLLSIVTLSANARTITSEQIIAGSGTIFEEKAFLTTYSDGSGEVTYTTDPVKALRIASQTLAISTADSREVVSIDTSCPGSSSMGICVKYKIWTQDTPGGSDTYPSNYIYYVYGLPTSSGNYWTQDVTIAMSYGVKYGTLPSNAAIPCSEIETQYGETLKELDTNHDSMVSETEFVVYIRAYLLALYTPAESKALSTFVRSGCVLSAPNPGTPTPTPTGTANPPPVTDTTKPKIIPKPIADLLGIKETPGFGAILAIVGIMAVVYYRRKP